MALHVSESAGEGFDPIEQGSHVAICYSVVDIGYQYSDTYKKSSPKVVFSWELPDSTVEVNGEQERRVISKTFTTSLHKKSSLRKTLEAWRGKNFTEEELKGFNLGKLLGAACLLQINHTERNGKVYADIASVVTLPKSMPKPQLKRETVLYDYDEPDDDVYEKLPNWMKDRINAAVDSKDAILSGGSLDDELPF